MTKKIFAMFLAVLMVVSVLPTSVFAAGTKCPGAGEHTLENCSYTVVKVTDPTCGTMGFTTYKCDKCGETFSESWTAPAGEHTWIDLPAKAPTCAKPGNEAGRMCAVCGKQECAAIPQLDPQAEDCEWVDLTPSINCETGGTKKFECAKCDATWEFEVEPGVHAWDNDHPYVVKPATTTEKGLAIVTCTICYAEKEVEILFAHEHDYNDPAGYIVKYEMIPATCTTTGMQEYLQCRVCESVNFKRDGEWGWYQLTEAEWATLVIPASHKFLCPGYCDDATHTDGHVATCVDTILSCGICKQTVTVNIAHEVDWVETDWQVSDGRHYFQAEGATCSNPGWIADWCNVCREFRDVMTLAALGHIEVTVNVPATCVSNAYSFTYCTRASCNEGRYDPEALYPMVADTFAPVDAPAVDTPFYLAMNQVNLETVLYFTGKMDGNYLATSHDVGEAVAVYLEIVHPKADNTYRMYFYNAEGVKTYIEIYEYDTVNHKVGVHLTVNPVNVYNWDANNNVLTTTLNNTVYYLNSYNNFETISASKISYIATSFPARLGAIGVEASVNVIRYEIKNNSINTTAHMMTSEIIIAPTCTEPGMKQVRCALCGGAAAIVEVPAAHNFEPMVGKITIDGKQVDASKAVDCEAGWQYFQCTGCGEIKKVTYTGYGHVLTPVIEETPDHVNPVVYDHQDCIYCDYSLKLTKKTWNDANKHWDNFDAANEAHDYALVGEGRVVEAGSCTQVGLMMFTCSDCNKAVYVKIAGTGEHVIPEGTVYLAPTCTEKGHIATYECARCHAIVGAAALGELNTLPALGHAWMENENYVPAECFAPNYNNYTHFCARCGIGQGDGTMLIKRVVFDDTNPCEAIAFEYYFCHCGEEHMISVITELGHNYIELPRYDATGKEISANFKAPTCYAPGYTTYVCSFCDDVVVDELAMVEHVNAAGEKFTDKCTDTVEDRHCVVCHAYYKHDKMGSAHDCYTTDLNKDGVLDCECMIGKFCHFTVNTNMPSTCLQDAYTLKVCGDCGFQQVVPQTGYIWNGHMPASNMEYYKEIINENGEIEVVALEKPEPIRLSGYHYIENFVWYSVEVENGEFVQKQSEPYTAKFIEYVPATYASNGYAKMYCQECKQVVTQILPKLAGLGVELDAYNANGTGIEATTGSLVAVDVSLNSLNTGIYGFNVTVDAPEGAIYVGYEIVNEDFIMVVTEPVKASVKAPSVAIAGYAANNAAGQQQNIVINEKTTMLTVYFRMVEVNTDAYGLVTFTAEDTTAYDLDHFNDANKGEVYMSDATGFVVGVELGDFNRDGAFHITDVYTAMTLISNDEYDVSVDMNRDGKVTAKDLTFIYNILVGNVNYEEMMLNGVDEAEAEFLKAILPYFGHEYECNSSDCDYTSNAPFNYCPECGNRQ